MVYFTQKRLQWLFLSMLLSSITSMVWAVSLPADSDDTDDDVPPPKTGLLHRLLHGQESEEKNSLKHQKALEFL